MITLWCSNLLLFLCILCHGEVLLKFNPKSERDESETYTFLQAKSNESLPHETNLDTANDSTNVTETFSKDTDLEEQKLMSRGLDRLYFCRQIGEFLRFMRTRKTLSQSGRKDSFNRSPSQRSFREIEVVDVPNSEELLQAQSINNVQKIREGNGEFTDKRGKLRTKNEWPIVYSTHYDVNACGLQKHHPFDVKKWGNIFSFLKKEGMLSSESISAPEEATEEMLLLAHTPKYLYDLLSSYEVANITEIPQVAKLPLWMVKKNYLKPMRFQVGGSVLAGELALHRGWAINIGGGFHHASKSKGGGFCAYADITVLIKWLFLHYPQRVKKAMIVDLDAHQGNGHETDFLNDKRVFIMDVYNKNIYPFDHRAKDAIKRTVELENHTADDQYLELVEKNLEISLQQFDPDILVYNAGTDILIGDPLGKLDISAEGIMKRDALVFTKVRAQSIPIVMLTSGGYLPKTADIIARSILNLEKLKLIAN